MSSTRPAPGSNSPTSTSGSPEQSGFPERAEGYVSAIFDYCDRLAEFPMIGLARDDLRPGLRAIGFRHRAVIAFAVHEVTVEIHDVYYGGQDYEALIAADEN